MPNGRGGRRKGAGRKPGSTWKPAVASMRAETVRKMKTIVGSERDPLGVLVEFVLDENRDDQTRMSAANILMPFLYPRLSASTVDARHTVTTVDANAVLAKLNDRIERLGKSDPPPMIEGSADEDGAGE